MWGGLAGKGAFCQARKPEFNSWKPLLYKERSDSRNCSLFSTCYHPPQPSYRVNALEIRLKRSMVRFIPATAPLSILISVPALFPIALIKHPDRSHFKRKGLFSLHFQVTVYHWEVKAGTWSIKSHAQSRRAEKKNACVHAYYCSADFLQSHRGEDPNPGITGAAHVLPTSADTVKAISHRLSTGQPDPDSPSLRLPSQAILDPVNN